MMASGMICKTKSCLTVARSWAGLDRNVPWELGTLSFLSQHFSESWDRHRQR